VTSPLIWTAFAIGGLLPSSAFQEPCNLDCAMCNGLAEHPRLLNRPAGVNCVPRRVIAISRGPTLDRPCIRALPEHWEKSLCMGLILWISVPQLCKTAHCTPKLHTNSVEQLWREMLGDEFLLRPRLSRTLYNGRYSKYPPELGEVLWGVGPDESFKILTSWAKAQLWPDRPERTFSCGSAIASVRATQHGPRGPSF
jgi:hypothetical protein